MLAGGGQTTAPPPPHVPLVHTSFAVQASVSLHLVPSTLAGFEQAPLVVLQTPTLWHWSLTLHTTGLLPTHTPAVLHVSVCVHLLPSSQAPVLTGFEQLPVVVSHAPAVWHWSLAVHDTALPGEQTPVLHVSALVHALPSLQLLPSVLIGFEQLPVVESQLPATWHWSLGVHVTEVPPHLPVLHTSVSVHRFLSSHPMPSVTGTALHTPVASHLPVLQPSVSAEQSTAVPPVHLPALVSQVRPLTHGSVLQSVSIVQLHLLKSWLQPVGSMQLSTLQPSVSAQDSAPPPHAPVVHLSPVVQVLPSLHSVPSVLVGFEQVPVVGLQVPAVWH